MALESNKYALSTTRRTWSRTRELRKVLCEFFEPNSHFSADPVFLIWSLGHRLQLVESVQSPKTLIMTFLQLPDEVLIYIFEVAHINSQGSEYLYRLSQICKRIQQLLLPIFLTRIGVLATPVASLIPGTTSSNAQSQTNLVFARKRIRLIPLLRSTGYFVHTTHLNCAFRHRGGDSEVSQVFTEDIRNTREFLSDLKDLRHLTLDFTSVEFWINTGTADGVWFKSCAEELKKLLEDVGKMGLEQLVLRSGVHVSQTRWPLSVHAIHETSIRPQDTAKAKDTTLDANGNGGTGEAPSNPMTHTDITQFRALNIHSMMFMSGPVLKITKGFLSSASVTHFSLGYVSLEDLDWGNALPMLSFPTLQSFTLSHCNLPFDRLVQFLDRHSTIRDLRLGVGLREPPTDPFPESSLVNLHSLITPASHLHWLLHHKRQSLRSACVLVQVSRRTPFSKFLQSITSSPSTLYSYDVALHITLEAYATRFMLTDITSFEGQPESRDLQSVKAIEITSIWKEVREFCPVFASWLAIFPELHTLAVPVPSYPILPPYINPFIEQLKNRCPKLRTIKLPDGVVEIFQGSDGLRYKRFVSF